MKSRILLIVTALIASQVWIVRGDSPRFAISGDASTTGLGGSVWITTSDRFVLSAGYGTLGVDHDYSTDGVDYDGSADLANGHAIIRWYPSAKNFNVSFGAVFADNGVEVVGRPTDGATYEIGGVEYPASAVGTITGAVDWDDSVIPYLGIGWSKNPQDVGWGAFLDLGAMYSGDPEATLSATGPIASDPTFQSRLQVEERDVNDELDEFKVFPVIRLGVLYRF